MADAPVVDARALRSIAEFADGFRERHLVVVRQSDGEVAIKPAKETGDEVILQVLTDAKEPDRVGVQSLLLEAPGLKEQLAQKYDAVFWSESSIEKFLLPYYYSMRVLRESDLTRLRTNYANDKDIVALAHTPPTRTSALRASDDAMSSVRVLGGRRQDQSLKEFLSAP